MATSDPFTTGGETAERHLDYIVDWVKRMIEPYQSSRGYVETHVLQLTPVIASLLARAGYSKDDVAAYLTKNAVVPARYFPARNNVPNWNDVAPRLGMIYDLFGDGKTAIKAGFNKYMHPVTT